MDAVLQATLQVLLRPALGSLTTTRVAKVAGVSVGTLYQYFPNREALLIAVLTRYLEGIRNATLGGLERARNLEPEPAMREVLRSLLVHKRRTQETSRGLRPWVALVEGVKLQHQVFASLGVGLAELLAGKFGAAGDALHRALLLMGAMDGMLAASLDAGPKAFNHPALEETLVQVALAVARTH